MESRIRVLLAESDDQFRTDLRKTIEKDECLELIGATADGLETLQLLKLQPDVLVLDLMMPQKDGVQILAQLPQLAPGTRCIITSSFLNDELAAEVAGLNASYLIRKPCEAEWLTARIVRLWRKPPIIGDEYLLPLVSWVLQWGCVPVQLTGFNLLSHAICMVVRNPQLREGITKQLYPALAQRCNSSPQGVERGIRISIGKAWERGLKPALEHQFQRRFDRCPSNAAFIAMMAEYVQKLIVIQGLL